eukprot:310702-Prymnesium_polylepis.1
MDRGCWSKIAACVAVREAGQCRHRWDALQESRVEKGTWSMEEEERLLELLREHGRMYTAIAPLINRSTTQ